MSATALVVTRAVAALTVTPETGSSVTVQAGQITAALTASGDQGPAGVPGAIGATGRTLEIEIEAAGGAQAITIPTPFGGVQSLFRNGLRERMSSFSTVGNIVTLPGFTEAGDIVSILYFPS